MSVSPGFMSVPDAARFVLRNAHVPAVLVDGVTLPVRDGLAAVDIVIADGTIESLRLHPEEAPKEPSRRMSAPPSPFETPAARPPQGEGIEVDLGGAIVFPCFVELHTHLDKGHIWPRRANPDGTFRGALDNVPIDRAARWSREDVRRRMDFSLRCAYAHGTSAIRTHLDSVPPQDEISWPLFAEMREIWRGRIELQAVALAGGDWALDPDYLTRICKRVKEIGGLLGYAMASYPRAREVLAALIRAATDHGLDLDLHLDETQDTDSDCLRIFAEEILAARYQGRATAGHCCSLARQPRDEAMRTIELVAKAGISVVSLPMCNLYLQDRTSTDAGPATPHSRGVTLLRELAAAGVKTAVSSDNTRDPFYAYGDLDALEVLRESIRIAHLDHPIETAPALITRNPADIMQLPRHGRLAAGLPANLVLFEGRRWSELYSRPQTNRIVLRAGKAISRAPPHYRELDDLMEP